MVRHILRMIWNRKRANVLLLLEMLISAVVLFLVLTQILTGMQKFFKPLGFEFESCYRISVSPGELGNAENNTLMTEVIHSLAELPQVEAVTPMTPPPFENSTWRTTFGRSFDDFHTNMHLVRAGFEQVLGLQLEQGSWPTADDVSASRRPIVVTHEFLRQFYPDEGEAMVAAAVNPIGRFVDPDDNGDTKVIAAVIPDFRAKGELMSSVALYFHLVGAEEEDASFISDMVIKLHHGTEIGTFEQEAIGRIQAIAPDWSLQLNTLESMRTERLREWGLPLLVAALVVLFLLLMVGFGLIGVLWQSVTRRRKEIGLRRALGASRGEIYRQLLGEIAILALLALAGAWLIVLQLPFLGILDSIGWRSFLESLFLSTAVILSLALLAGAYPAWLSSRIMPSEALHHE